jgi:hypothetical protein
MNSASFGTMGSGFGRGHFTNFSMRFCTLAGNGFQTCIYFGGEVAVSDVSCIALVGNRCHGGSEVMGLIFSSTVTAEVTVSRSFFRGNAFDYFVGKNNAGQSNITFFGCVFDVDSLNSTGLVSLTATACFYDPDPTSLPGCSTRTPMPSRTASISVTESMSPSLSGTPSDIFTPSLEAGRRRRMVVQFDAFIFALAAW